VHLKQRIRDTPLIGSLALRASIALRADLTEPPLALVHFRRDRGDKTLRLEYDLDSTSVVVDVGGFEGQWASDIVAMYGCQVHVFEPVPAFAWRIRDRFAKNPLVVVHDYGLASADDTLTMSLSGDASSHVSRSADASVRVRLCRAASVLDALSEPEIHLMKLNIEGAEFGLLEHLLDEGWIPRIRDLQVQFHDAVPDARRRAEAIRDRLRLTHEITYQYDFVWENWRRLTDS
jgi:FkbM family methyltransferase